MKFACFVDTSAPPIAKPLSPQASTRRAAWSPGGLRNTLPAFGRESGCVAIRRSSSCLIRASAASVTPGGNANHAARLIESCGLKGYAVGGARVSEKHANFIVNPEGRARAADIEAIVGHVREVVRERTGVELRPEVEIIGEAVQ